MAARPLTPKQARFVDEYVLEPNATQAAIRAGYSAKSAYSQGQRLLKNAEVKRAIATARKQRKERLQIEGDDILRELLLIARSDIGDILDFTGPEPRLKPASQIPESARRAVSSFKVRRVVEGTRDDPVDVEITEFKLWDKLGAIKSAMQHLGIDGPTKVEVSGELEVKHDYAVTLTAADIAAARGIMGVEGGDLPPDGGSQPVGP